jgi:hypothetical protein
MALVGLAEEKRTPKYFDMWDKYLNGFQKKMVGGMDCTDLAQDRDQWRALVNKAMNLRVP